MMDKPVTKHRGLKFKDGFNSKFCAVFEIYFLVVDFKAPTEGQLPYSTFLAIVPKMPIMCFISHQIS